MRATGPFDPIATPRTATESPDGRCLRGVALGQAQKLSLDDRAALQLPGLPAGIDPPEFETCRLHQRYEHRFAYARVERGRAQEQPLRFQVGRRLR